MRYDYDFASLVIPNYTLFAPNYNVKCLIGKDMIDDLYRVSSFSQFDLTSAGISNFRTNNYQDYDTYQTLCSRMVVCPEGFPFYNASSQVCLTCPYK
jgi:hypothetical protein